MRKIVLILCLFILITPSLIGQAQRGRIISPEVPSPQQHYLPEYTFDTPVDRAAWQAQRKGLHAAFGTTDELYLRSEVPVVPDNNHSWQRTGWKGERLNAQLLVWSPDSLKQVRVTVSDLVNEHGQSLGKDVVTLHLVRYVLSNYPYAASKTHCDTPLSDTTYLMPDRLEPFGRFDLPGNSVRPVWLSVEIPSAAAAGNYTGTVDVNSETGHVALRLSVTVQSQLLPPPHDWSYRLDLWQNPWVVASYYQLEPWSEEHKLLLKKHLRPYAEAGGKYITTYAVHSPWSDNSYAVEGAMIDIIKQKDGTWMFDYAIFDQYVQLAMDAGVDKFITLYTPVPWAHRFRYMDAQTGNYRYETWPPDSAPFKAFWTVFLTDLKTHLDKKGWLEKTYLGINENPLAVTLAAITVIKEHWKGWKITYAGDWHPELKKVLDDYSVVISSEPSAAELKERVANRLSTTYYVCCTPPQPNNFVFSPPVEGQYLGWYASAYGYDGFLRWAYDAWPADPMRDARHTLWPAGDCFLVYPGGAGSIRFEKLREGIVDYEKIRLLRERASASSDKKVKLSLKALETHLTTFIGDRDYSKRDYEVKKMTEAVHKGRRLVETLSNDLR